MSGIHPVDSVSLAVFYKHFNYPIEWTYTVAGGTDLIYSYKCEECQQLR